MSYSSALTKKRILSCAKNEFISHGFLNTNMRTIAQKAQVTTGAMYNHFKNKELLFEALVGDTASELLELFEEWHIKCEAFPTFFEDSPKQTFEQGADTVLDYIYEHFEQVQLLVCYSAYTKYEQFVDDLIAIEERSTLHMLEKQGFDMIGINKFFVHVMASSSISNMFEAVQHDLSKKEANLYMKKIQQFHYAGWKEIIGQ